MTGFAAVHGIPLVALVPYDDDVRLADLAGTPLFDGQGSEAVREIDRLAGWLLANT